MNDIHATLLLRTLKGSPSACLLALLFSPGPVTARWISWTTGYCPNTVTKALSLLETLGLASHDGRRSDWHTHLRLTTAD